MTKWICEIGAYSWFYYTEISYDARSHERKKKSLKYTIQFNYFLWNIL
jgi:hypothetical protein